MGLEELPSWKSLKKQFKRSSKLHAKLSAKAKDLGFKPCENRIRWLTFTHSKDGQH